MHTVTETMHNCSLIIERLSERAETVELARVKFFADVREWERNLTGADRLALIARQKHARVLMRQRARAKKMRDAKKERRANEKKART